MKKHAYPQFKTALIGLLTLVTMAAHAQDAMMGEIRFFAGNFAPRGWALCDGQLLSIAQHSALFAILGTTYGGDGRTTFALPDMRGRSPIHQGVGAGLQPIPLGQKGGSESLTLTTQQLPAHSHAATLSASQEAADSTSGGHLANPVAPLAQAPKSKGYASSPLPEDLVSVNGLSIGNAGQSRSFNHRNPYVAVNCIIALTGTFPSRN